MKILLIDNYDSFTYNLFQYLEEAGAAVTVVRNDQFRLADVAAYDKIVLSPGPGIPSEAGLLEDVIKAYAGQKPILGICLGEQAIGEVFGGQLHNLDHVFHGVQTLAHIVADDYLFHGLPRDIAVGRYHSWVVQTEGLPDCIEVTALSDEGQIMALCHKEYDVHGIQFHPESILTPDGRTMIENFVRAKTQLLNTPQP